MRKVLIALLSICFLCVGGFVIMRSDFLNIDNDSDVIKYNGRTYSNISELEWFEKEKSKYQKGERIGEIKRISKSSFLLWDFSATKAPKGTVLYKTVDTKEGKPLIILAETDDGEILYYRWLPKE